MNFNPRSREGSDKGKKSLRSRYCISIHAPARGATRLRFVFLAFRKISIHAPARGATSKLLIKSIPFSISIHAPARGATSDTIKVPVLFMDFNPRSREGSDAVLRPLLECVILISIHAPARGATPLYDCFPLLHTISIHAPARGATRTMTMPSGFVKYFNPRSREGSDGILRTVRTKIIMISIHAPARGATCRTIHFYNSNNISIHAPARGATWSP